MYRIKIIFLLMLVCLLQSCSRQPTVKNADIVTIKPEKFSSSLFYSGIVQPLKTLVIPSPAEGVVLDMNFQYGEKVKSGQLLFTLASTKFLTDYKSALLQYIKAKNELNNSQTQMKEADFLHKNQLISDDEFKSKKSNFYGNQLAFIQAKDALEILLKQLDIKDIDLYQLNIEDVDKITQAMHLQLNSESLHILSPADGIVLSANKSEEESKKIMKGDVVKQGDPLAIIGDMGGLTIKIKINEMTVNQLKIGQKVLVTGIAFDDVLPGEIKRIDRQGDIVNGGIPTFPVDIAVPVLSQKQQQQIHVGMSAKVEINVEEETQVIIPINALFEKDNISYVKVYDTKLNKVREVKVKTGKTTIASVVILTGLHEGDKLVIPH